MRAPTHVGAFFTFDDIVLTRLWRNIAISLIDQLFLVKERRKLAVALDCSSVPPRASGTVLDILGARGCYRREHHKPVANERETEQTPQSTRPVFYKCEDNQCYPHQRQK